MKYAFIALSVVAISGPASAANRASDVDYMRANRCKGLAAGLPGVVDSQALDAFIKAERGARVPYVLDRGAEEQARAKKEARSEDRRERLTAELAGACQAFVGPASSVARQ